MADDAAPLRAELFSAAQMAVHGRKLAARHQLTTQAGSDRLLERLDENERIIADACIGLTKASKAGALLTPAADWLLDNYYLIEEQVRLARSHLPKDYSRELPCLADADACGHPRVYQLALEVIAHGDGRLEPESLARFVAAYQEGAPLTMGELWAIPIMLRLALIENLRRIAARQDLARRERELANGWADRMVDKSDDKPGDLILLVADMARAVQPMGSSFVAELTRRLQGRSGPLTQALQWIGTRLADEGRTIEQAVQADIGQQAADQVSVANSIGSQRLLDKTDWREFVETLSTVEQTLRMDPAGVYGKMDFGTRDHYRHVVEQLARATRKSEMEVAAEAVALAGEGRAAAAVEGAADAAPADGSAAAAASAGASSAAASSAAALGGLRLRHVGYYLAGAGLARLERRLNLQSGFVGALRRAGRRRPLLAYLGAIGAFTALFTGAAVVHAAQGGAAAGLLWTIGVLTAIGSSQLALALVNLLSTRLVSPKPLARMDFSDGIPPDARAVVVVPSLLYSRDNVATLCDALEVRYLANRDANLRFCLLTDLADAPQQDMPADAALVEQARAAIAALNAKYGHDHAIVLHGADGSEVEESVRIEPFLLLHRPRMWNASEGAWIGRERKRGKLEDLNAFLRGGAQDRFAVVEGALEGLDETRYVITLDADTQLPRDAARQFVAAMAHPLNHAVLDPSGRRVIEGYGLLQPRVTTSLPLENASRYERLCSGEPGIDPYTRAVSDVYQDLFGEGSFTGKGIYDLDVFERVLHGALPDNKVLSHDLLEGSYIRSGLLSDAQVVEAYPPRYSDDVGRRHRWIRGDWQLLGWIGGRAPAPGGRRVPNPLGALARWKLFDNLRRSLVAPVLTGLLLLCWALLPAPAFWSAAILSVFFLPFALGALIGLADKPHDMGFGQHGQNWSQGARAGLAHAVLNMTFLPHEAYYSVDAIARTGWRMLVSKRKLLEWRASGTSRSSTDMESNWRSMWFAPAFAVGSALLLTFANPLALWAAAPLLLLWFLSPVVAWWVSLPVERPAPQLGAGQQEFLHKLARRTWAFFEDHVTAEENWLPPDNMQEHPVQRVAQRTSPTNLGLALLANFTAWDFGYLAGGELLLRTRATLGTMGRLERYRGHFYNWYDTQTLAPLQPVYVSAVDSGNLAGHLLTLAAGLEQLAARPVVSSQPLHGVRDTLRVVEEHAGDAAPAVKDAIAVLWRDLSPEQCRNVDTLPGLGDCLAALARDAGELANAVPADADDALRTWTGKLAAQCRAAYADLLHIAPWMRAVQEHVIDSSLTRIPTLRELAAFGMSAPSEDLAPDERARLLLLARMVDEGSANARARLEEIARLARMAREFAAMDFTFMYNDDSDLLAIGYNVSERRLDSGSYDLLASEARLASFVGIAQGQFPQEHWFALGRQLSLVGGEQVLLSWSGSMFEYLMPLLVMPSYRDTLLDQTYHGIIHAQIDYGRRRNTPWGISESGYNTVDASMNYQYRAFGVPGTGAKRGLGEDLVIAPYATMMGLMVEPELACENLERMAKLGFTGQYGFYEAVDYTAARLPRGQEFAVVRSFMVHHQGMGFLALSYLLHDRPMQRRFEADPQFQATLLLLQERVPKSGAIELASAEAEGMRQPAPETDSATRVVAQPNTAHPEVQLLSNGRYHVMVTSSGAGYSRWKDLAVTRWREDATADDWGNFCYVRDLDSGAVWSTAYQPTLAQPEHYEVIFSEGRAEFRRRDHGIELHTEIVVSPEDDIELRRTRIKNTSQVERTIELTSYAEVVMAPPAADAAHPAFSKLFVQTEILAGRGAILCSRRPRHKEEQPPFLFNLMTVHGVDAPSAPAFETSRAQFIGRGNRNVLPQALTGRDQLQGAHGSVLDPVAAIRRSFTLAPDQEISVDVILGATDTREQALHLVDKYQDRHLTDRVFELAWTHSQVVLRQLNASEADAQLYGRLASGVIYPNAALRAEPAVIARNGRGQSGLWAYSISGDLPIVLLQIRDAANIELARQVVQAHGYWRLKGLVVDLVIWCEDASGYRQALHDQIMSMIASGLDAQSVDRPGGVFVRIVDQIPNEDRVLMQSVARLVLSDERGSLAEQLRRAALQKVALPPLLAIEPPLPAMPGTASSTTPAPTPVHIPVPQPAPSLVLDNGIGGFSADGREYVIRTGAEQRTPAPWVNVLASPLFGSIVSEAGQAYSWNQNAHEFRLTPWENDPVADRGGEAFYIRDEQTGTYWSPTALPAPSGGDYLTRHGFGYSAFEHTAHGIRSELLTYVALDDPLKYVVIKLRNDSAARRKLSVTGYVEWVLGDLRDKSAMHVVTEQDPVSGALFARNAYNADFSGRVAFFHLDAEHVAFTCDRTEFIGRNRSLANPAALERAGLSGRSGAALDPCAALQAAIELQPGEEQELVFMLGVGGRRNLDATGMVQRHGGAGVPAADLAKVRDWWDETLGAIRVETPEPALDAIANGWLMYQTIACRMWARSGYYQSGGAYGFRDQLQDAMATVHTRPELLRDHLLLFAGHQFVEGDVQHWWHPPTGRGVRTHCSDDYLWLPLAAHRYVTVTGDWALLDEVAPFIESRQLKQEEESLYDLPAQSNEQASLYEHCVRAIRHALDFGAHGLPLIGTCDWNDGMDRVGNEGKGESVWLGFFLYEVLQRFAELADRRADYGFATTCRSAAQVLSHNIEENAWDGEWYRRAYFDDGTPLGSQQNDECQIDSISQSWGVLSGAADPERVKGAMAAVDARLVRRDAGLIQLLDPPFDKGVLNPGYIRGYVPGVRENGGQYTHAAIWTAMAFARLGQTERAWELFDMINPVNHAASREACAVYKAEPYVMTADVYAVTPHVGRGGWSWYTGSAGWMYRLVVESLLGVERTGERLALAPQMPADWTGFKLQYRYRGSTYAIDVRRGSAASLSVDGVAQEGASIALVDDGRRHEVVLVVADGGASLAATAPQGSDITVAK
ncbi:cyclic beta 1-2 glucan synthetase [Massilia forsythiae]|uniref:Cyclic beta 1-2 glucan synthetase n=1 Tax=Massilia forsythiae TaxID=2728020 RepID=A0A7Z2ZV49_9BURK|nr:glycoside hydrolase family 94 protein [Massilia forsythiae]QJE03223.1 cyclic beta 1-2 glucan synthetase [Massilia forsythiae]